MKARDIIAKDLANLRERMPPEDWLLLAARLWVDRRILATVFYGYLFARRLINPCFTG